MTYTNAHGNFDDEIACGIHDFIHSFPQDKYN